MSTLNNREGNVDTYICHNIGKITEKQVHRKNVESNLSIEFYGHFKQIALCVQEYPRYYYLRKRFTEGKEYRGKNMKDPRKLRHLPSEKLKRCVPQWLHILLITHNLRDSHCVMPSSEW